MYWNYPYYMNTVGGPIGDNKGTYDEFVAPLLTGALIGIVGYIPSLLFNTARIYKYKNPKVQVAIILSNTILSGLGALAVTAVSKFRGGVLTGGSRDWITGKSIFFMFMGGLISSIIRSVIDSALDTAKGDPEDNIRPALLFSLREKLVGVAEKEDPVTKRLGKLSKKAKEALLRS